MLVFAAVMGLTFLSTVPPTAGLVAKFFGPANMATLFGIVMLTHQIGGFLGAWLGGKVFEATGAYDWVWYIDIVLAVGAALITCPSARHGCRPAAQPHGRDVSSAALDPRTRRAAGRADRAHAAAPGRPQCAADAGAGGGRADRDLVCRQAGHRCAGRAWRWCSRP
jgi:MFS family permease